MTAQPNWIKPLDKAKRAGSEMAQLFLCQIIKISTIDWVLISAIYRRIFKPQIFTDITTPAKQSYSPNTGKITQIKQISPFHYTSRR